MWSDTPGDVYSLTFAVHPSGPTIDRAFLCDARVSGGGIRAFTRIDASTLAFDGMHYTNPCISVAAR